MSPPSTNSLQQLENAPALRPPPGVQPNYVNPPSYESKILALECVFLPLMLIAVGVRIFVRSRMTKIWGWDDYTCITAAVGCVVHMILYVEMFKVGYGRHLWDVRPLELLSIHTSQLNSSNGIVYAFTIACAKVSILLLYLRIFKINRGLRWAIYFGIVITITYYTAFMGIAIGSIVKCSGAAQIYNPLCKSYRKPVIVMNVVVNVVTDVYVLLLPVPCVLKLQLSLNRRIGLLLVFGSGIVTCAVSLTRMIIFCVHYKDPDDLWIQGRNAQFTVIEINTAILVSCTSCFPAFFTKSKAKGSDIYTFLRSRIASTVRFSSNSGSRWGNQSGGRSGYPSASHDIKDRPQQLQYVEISWPIERTNSKMDGYCESMENPVRIHYDEGIRTPPAAPAVTRDQCSDCNERFV